MATTIAQAFSEFKGNLEITEWQSSLVSTRRQNVVTALGKELWLHADSAKVIGSWDRHTLTRYLSEGDVDIMVVLDYGKHSDWYTSDGSVKALDRFKSILDGAFPQTDKRRDRNCITMQFSEFRLDVVPAFKHDGDYYSVPDSVRKTWVPTDPIGFASGITQINTAMGGSFVPVIKMVKGWNRNNGWVLRSFHLECMLYQRYQGYSQGYTYPSMLTELFKAMPGYLGYTCSDPIRGDQVDSYLDNYAAKTRRQIAIEKAKAAASASEEAYGDQDKYGPSVAIKEWKALLGEFFPSYG